MDMSAKSLSPEVDASGAPSIKKWASPASWDRWRARITQLYTTEGKTLNEVMAIMAKEHGHHATYVLLITEAEGYLLKISTKPYLNAEEAI